MSATVAAVASAARHRFSKEPRPAITLLAGLGVEGDAHAGKTVQHRSRKRWRPDLPNLRQVHLLQGELLDELATRGFAIAPGAIGENVLTRGVDLLALPTGTQLLLGAEAVVELTGLRNPCVQMDRFAPGLQEAVLDRDADGGLVRRSGVMSIVLRGGVVRAGDPIVVTPPEGEPVPLRPV